MPFEIRAVTGADSGDLIELAHHLDSVNLPADEAEIAPIIEKSDRSFGGQIEDPTHHEYRFVLRDLDADRAVGSSLVLAQLGRRDAPYIYFQVQTEERYSRTLDSLFKHQVLSIGYSYDGPTELGGLVIHPDSRRVRERLGMQISYVRFLWIAMHRARFQNFVLAELLPPLEADGRSHLWEAVGRHFTGMTYREADRLSKRNKEFIKGLFPDGDIYVSLLSKEAQSVVGQVGPQTKGVEKLLRRIGFRYVNRIDPFDGGPHFAAATDEITLIRRTARRQLVAPSVPATKRALLGVSYAQAPWFRAQAVPATVDGDEIAVEAADLEHLELAHGDEVWSLPLE